MREFLVMLLGGARKNPKAGKAGLVLLIAAVLMANVSFAAQGPMITFRFDDARVSQYTEAFPILSSYGFVGTLYIPTQNPGWDGYLTWSQIQELGAAGWETGSHSVTHSDLTSLSTEDLISELEDSKTALENHGLTVKTFASPYGLVNNQVTSYIANYYESAVDGPDGLNTYPFSDYAIRGLEVTNSIAVDTVKSQIDLAVSNNQWLIILFHKIVESTPQESYEYNVDDFEEIVDYVNQQNIPVVTVSEGLALATDNLVINPSFESAAGGWADAWTESENILLDTDNNGCMPYPEASIKFIGGAGTYGTQTADFINVSPSESYILKTYFNCQTFNSGSVTVYIVEYDSDENEINKITKTSVNATFVGYKNALYAPSVNAAKVRVLIESAASSDLTCYVDNVVLAIDTSLAVDSFSINNGADTTTVQDVTLNNTCTGGPTHYMASESSDFSGASWQAYSTAPSFTLSSGYGTKTVYFKVKNAGGESNVMSDTIEYQMETVPPTVDSFSINNGAAATTSQDVTLNNACTGDPTHYMASESSDFSGASWQDYSAAPNFTLSSGYGTKTVYFKVKNAAGESGVVSDTINYKMPNPVVTSFMINNGALNTTNQIVTLNNTCTESPTRYMASESPTFEGAVWKAYSTAPSFTLSSGYGTKTVYFKVKNSGGQSAVVSDTINYKMPKPVVTSFKINNGAASTSSSTVTLNNTCTQNPTRYMASESPTFTGAVWKAYSTAPSFVLSSGRGTKTVYFKVKNAGGQSAVVTDTIFRN
jgi:peptidoglycan/xylan/chitin deacetylase (PgdA/CDA1 family)